MLRTVMLPTDFSEESESILGFAKGLPALGVKVVVLLHVVEASGLEGPIIASRVDDACDRLRGVAAALEEAGLSVEVRVPTGDPFDTIVGLASEMGVDAIVCGSHAKGLMTQLVAGSVSERLLRDAPVPMLLVRFDLLKNQSNPTTLLKRFGEKVLMPTDFSLSASHAFTTAMELPKGLIKTLYLMHVVDAGLTGEKLRKTEEGAEFHLRNLQAMAQQQGIATSIVISRGEPQRAILEELDERRATAVITGTRGRNAVQEALMGSVSMTLLKQASCPVMIVP
ncbi:MAG: UspA domain [Actinobacteria bacterium]|nr:MAG: UspA domain [Actinomycetota bacterium]MDO8949683.1 universal stress protein [Actinomycetota bacterium]